MPPVDRPPDFVWQPDEVRGVWEEEGLAPVASTGRTELDPFPRGQAFQFEAQRPAIAARGLAEAENELAGFVRSGNRVVVTFPHRGEALRQGGLLRKVESTIHDDGDAAAARRRRPLRRLARAARLRLARARGSSSCPTRRSSASGRPARTPGSAARLPRSPTSASATTSSTRTTASGSCSASRRRRSPASRATTSSSRSAARTGSTSRTSSSASSRATSAPTRSRRRSRSSAARPGRTSRRRARESVRELAGELLALYAQRQRAEGASFDLSNEWLERLEASFPYRETDDQARAIEAVKEDLESPRPMDRLVCGDVGFGKTEVAVRAAFAVAVNGRQVLVLCPTTILAEQHWNTFRERFRDFPLNVEMVSRFRKPAETKQVLADFADGKVDVLVGTHRVLSRDVIPKELGLVILDEEQRFGVAQKELLRSLRLEVDVLALSATPIPRTLHMSLAGLRDISIIETPPEGRRPIRTNVGEYDEELIKVALEREHARGGQAFYLHNRVETIEEVGREAPAALPRAPLPRRARADGRARPRGAHARVPRRRRRRARLDDDHRVGHRHPAGEHAGRRARRHARAQPALPDPRPGRPLRRHRPRVPVLSRRDRADRRRRARASRRSPTTPSSAPASRSRCATSRSAAPATCSEPSSPGHVAALGFELYVEMLNEAVAELSGQARAAVRPVRVDARVDAFIPASYVASEALKIDLHRRLALVEHDDELRELRAGVEDRYGPLPEPVENLFSIQEAKLKLALIGADYLVYRGGRATVGPLALGSDELRALRAVADTLVYTQAKREVSLRTDDLKGALGLADAIVAARSAA